MKKYLFLLLTVLFLFPYAVFGKGVGIDDERVSEYINVFPEGYQLLYTTRFNITNHLFFDDTEVELTQTVQEGKTWDSAIVPADGFFYRTEMINQGDHYDYYYHFHVITGNEVFYLWSDEQENNYYLSSEFFLKPSYYQVYFYDEDNNLIESYYNENSVEKLPLYNNQKAYWKLYRIDDTYSEESIHFVPVKYDEPVLTLTCKDSILQYGQSTECQLTATATHNLTELHFNMNHENLTISDIRYEDKVEKITGDKEYNIKINDQYAMSDSPVVLLRFTVTSKDKKPSSDMIELVAIDYTDDVISSSHNDLKSNIDIILGNPYTLMHYTLLLIPILLFVGVFTYYFIRKRRIEKC